jgi:hypothetical protein
MILGERYTNRGLIAGNIYLDPLNKLSFRGALSAAVPWIMIAVMSPTNGNSVLPVKCDAGIEASRTRRCALSAFFRKTIWLNDPLSGFWC